MLSLISGVINLMRRRPWLTGIAFSSAVGLAVVLMLYTAYSHARTSTSPNGNRIHVKRVTRYGLSGKPYKDVDLEIVGANGATLVYFKNIVMLPPLNLNDIVREGVWIDDQNFEGLKLSGIRANLRNTGNSWMLLYDMNGTEIQARPADWKGPGGPLRTSPPEPKPDANPLHH